MQDAEAVDEVEALLEPGERERVHPAVLDGRAQQAMDGSEALPALQLDAPPRRDQQPILLVIHRHNPLGSPALGEEGIETVEAADVKDARSGEVLG